MDRPRALQSTAVLLVIVTLVASGPGFGLLAPTASTPEHVGHGNATVTAVHVADPVVDRGRFGTGVAYARLPDARVSVRNVTGQPRLLYRVRIPELGVDARTHRQLAAGDRGTYRLALTDRALPDGLPANETVSATLTVTVQSFDAVWVAARRNVTVEVAG
ncbi:MAG: hypothetical protein ABEJ89_10255 [Haloarculaceae archaeon]